MTLTWESVCQQVLAAQARQQDVTVARSEVALAHGCLTLTRPATPEDRSGWPMSPWACAQLCQRLKIPVGYFRRCPPALQDAQANHWLKAGTRRREHWLLRVQDGRLRGLLSDRYALLDHPDVLAALTPVLTGRFEVAWCALSDESLHLRLTDPRLSREVLPQDRLVAGLHLANSEVGYRALTVDVLVYRLMCTNGLIRLVKGKSLLVQRHVSLSKLRVAARLKAAVEEALLLSAGFIERMSQATQEPVPDMDRTLKQVAGRWSLSKATQQHVRRALLTERAGQQETLYGLVNALTQAAQSLPPEERTRLETQAGQLMEHGLGPRGLRPLPGSPAESGEAATDPADNEGLQRRSPQAA